MDEYSFSKNGARELGNAIKLEATSLVSIGIFSVFVNLLMLTGPLFVLQIYDRVLGSRSEETLVAFLVLVTGLYGLMGVLDHARTRIGARVGARFQAGLDRRVFKASLKTPRSKGQPNYSTVLRDIEAVQRLLSSPALFSFLDILWAPIFIFVIFIFHPFLGWLALGGGILLVLLAAANQFFTFGPVGSANKQSRATTNLADSFISKRETVRAMGMESSALSRWQKLRNTALVSQVRVSDLTGSCGVISKTFRLFLQSLIVALGAYLVLQGEITAGAMIAGPIMLGRALAPVEQTIVQWPLILRAAYGWRGLTRFLGQAPNPEDRIKLPKPRAFLEVKNIVVLPPKDKQPALKLNGFNISPGIALGIIGTSASGKSTLAKALTGIWPIVSGSLRLDGALIDHYGQDLGEYIGYLPQDVTLFEATVAENIAKLSEKPDANAVIAAAKKAGAHEMILKLSDGYDTVITGGSGNLSGGQKQRIGLARAMYGEPVMLVLDEPNASLDASGSDALNRAIKQFKAEGNSVIIMAHRPSGIAECDLLLVLQDGVQKAFGPREEVLRAQVQNHEGISKNINSMLPS